ncbi:Ig-like domain-containing protein [Microvirga pudoricolor]|uniref:Ig-like domain-containing protein n=1 Tax=Microvirga pudoricolor TaxID=2778729 RepID=UPI00194DE52A|nr:Ig-like domain-containing protein [Microvirga pudoricolor]MBM6593640.1 cadherin-like domain-containing protein [Microvirga pudoricolor]
MYQLEDDKSVFDFELHVTSGANGNANTPDFVVIPDKDLLFLAEFERHGDDLLLFGQDQRTAIVVDYFKGHQRAALVTADGAGLSGAAVEALAEAHEREEYAQAQAADLPTGRRPIGQVQKVSGSATVMRNGVLVELQAGDNVSQGDVVQTASNASLVIKFNDGTVFGLSSNARIVLNEMIYSASAAGNSALFTLVQGVIGFVAGRVAKTGDFHVDTPVATMAIRGTAVQTEISAVSGVTTFSLLTEPDGKVGSFQLYYKYSPSRLIASVSDPSRATVVTPLSPTEVRVSEIAKSSDAVRSENGFFRDLFQFSSSGQRRGSSDVEGIPVIPASDTVSPIEGRSDTVPVLLFQAPTLQKLDIRLPERAPPIAFTGAVFEDGPMTQVESRQEARPFGWPIDLPDRLPAGVTYDAAARSFTLDPSDPAYQGLAAGETLSVEVRYAFRDENSGTPASIAWTVTGRNDAPQARPDRAAHLGETGRTVLALGANDSDIDGDALRVVSWSQPIEGRVLLSPSGDLVFDPGRDFRALSEGQTATVRFTYTISDGHGGFDTAVATLQVDGHGTFVARPALAQAEGRLGVNHQPVTLTIRAPSQTTTEEANLDLSLTLGDVVQPTINVLYAIDISGSTAERFSGAAVGDVNGDGRANTILDAEIASLIHLTDRIRGLGFADGTVTVTVIPFNGAANPAEPQGPHQTGANTGAKTFGLGEAGDGALARFLTGLSTGGATSYERALQATLDKLQELDQGGETNIVYFLSDGNGTGDVRDEKQALETAHGARISAVGIGDDASLAGLNLIDNTGSAQILNAFDQLDLSLLGRPVSQGSVLDLDLFVNGAQLRDVGPEDLVGRAGDWRLSVPLADLDRFVGEHNTVLANVTLTGGQVFSAQLDIAGRLPRSTDLIL